LGISYHTLVAYLKFPLPEVVESERAVWPADDGGAGEATVAP
jgi:hypothetical protein